MANFTQQGQDFGQALNIDPRLLLQKLIESTQMGGNLLGQVSPMMNPSMTALPEAMIKGANKALGSLGEKYAMEAAQTPQGLQSLNQVITQNISNQQIGGAQSQPSMGQAAPTPQTPEQAAPQATAPQATAQPQQGMSGQPTQPQGMDVLSKLLMTLGTGLNTYGGGNSAPLMSMIESRSNAADVAPGRALDNQLKQQELSGQKPLQAGERDKIGLETDKEIAKIRATLASKGYEGLPADQATKFGMLLEGRDAVTQIDQLVGSGDVGGIAAGQRFTPDFFKSPAQRDLQLALETAVDNRTRIETGAALGKGELEREAKKLMPRIGDDKSTWRKRMGRSFDFFNRSVATMDPQGIHEQRAGAARQRFAQDNLKQQAIQELARRRGQHA